MYDKKALNDIASYFIKTSEHLAVAESVTSGHLQAALSLVDSASNFFQGGITTYNVVQKFRHLHIDLTKAVNCNCVSREIAEAMALNICKLFITQWGIGITGYAVPIEEQGIIELFAYYAIAFKGKIVQTGVLHAPNGSKISSQVFYTNCLLDYLSLLLKDIEIE